MAKSSPFLMEISTIQGLNEWVARTHGEGIGIDLNARVTPPRVAARRIDTWRKSRQSGIRVLRGFSDPRSSTETVSTLRNVLAQYVRYHGERLLPSAFLIFGADNRLLHGHVHWRELLDETRDETAQRVELDDAELVDLNSEDIGFAESDEAEPVELDDDDLNQDEADLDAADIDDEYLSDPDAATGEIPDDLPFDPSEIFLLKARPKVGDCVWVQSPMDAKCYYATVRAVGEDTVQVIHMGTWQGQTEQIPLDHTYLVLARSPANSARVLEVL